MIGQKDWDLMRVAIEELSVKNKWQIKLDGNRAKVVRESESEYTIYYDGYFVETVVEWQSAFECVKAILIVDRS